MQEELCLEKLHVEYGADWKDNAVEKSEELLATASPPRRRRGTDFKYNQEAVLFEGNCEEYKQKYSDILEYLKQSVYYAAGCSAKINRISCVYSFYD